MLSGATPVDLLTAQAWVIYRRRMGQPVESLGIPALNSAGDLPRGRYCVSMDDVEARFVAGAEYEGSNTREEVWTDFNVLLDLIRQLRVRVPAAFLGGGFVTSALDPSDVDAAIIVDTSRITSQSTFAEISKIIDNPKGRLNLRVDAFLIRWHPDGTEVGGDPMYLAQRGKWDDFWQRKVAKADRNPPQRSHAMPVRGYLEVLIDGYR